MSSGRFLSIRASLITALLTFSTSTLANAASAVKEVNCSAGKNITEVLSKAESGDTIQITGTCTERLAITTDRLTLDGQGSATLNGGGSTGGSFAGVIEIQGARGVVIKGLTVQNGPNGIAASGGAAFYVRDSVFQNHAGSGMLIIGGSTGELTNCAMLKNGAGMNVLTGSTVVLKGPIAANENAGNGIFHRGRFDAGGPWGRGSGKQQHGCWRVPQWRPRGNLGIFRGAGEFDYGNRQCVCGTRDCRGELSEWRWFRPKYHQRLQRRGFRIVSADWRGYRQPLWIYPIYGFRQPGWTVSGDRV